MWKPIDRSTFFHIAPMHSFTQCPLLRLTLDRTGSLVLRIQDELPSGFPDEQGERREHL
jgi:hypothetical protein